MIHVFPEPDHDNRRDRIRFRVEGNGCHTVVSHAFGQRYLPSIRRNDERVYLPRYCYELAVGPVPNGMYLVHSCDNPRCINTEHLTHRPFIDTRTYNTESRKAIAKMSEELGNDEVHRRTGVGLTTIWRIRKEHGLINKNT